MNFWIHPDARDELRAAVAYYDKQRAGLGDEFYDESIEARGRIAAQPGSWKPLENGLRCCLLHRFPYGIVYQVEDDLIRIYAVMHLRRKPGYWQDRLL